MKFSLFALLPVVGLFATTMATPVAAPVEPTTMEVRATVADVESLLTTLLTNIKAEAAKIQTTLLTLPAGASAATKKTFATTKIAPLVGEITALLAQAKAAVPKTPVTATRSVEVEARQLDATAIATLLQQILGEVVTIVNSLVASLGLTSLLGFLQPLLGGLSGLLLSLIPVVDGLLVLVGTLVDGLLLALAGALSGIVL